MTENNYETPDSNLIIETDKELQLASRLHRLIASLLDTIIMMVVIGPAMYATGMYDKIFEGQEPSLSENALIALLGIGVFVLVNYHYLKTNGQTVGKKLLGIRIVDLDGNPPSMTSHLLPRYAVYFGIGYIPFVGGILSIVNILFIFRKDKRCLHDLAAKTMVVDN